MTLKDRFNKLCKRLRADAVKGSAAIEFAIVAPVFFMLLLGTFEAGIMFFSQAALQNAVTNLGRQVRTGQTACYTTSGGACVAMTETQFKSAICNTAGLLLTSCTSKLIIDMRAYSAGFSAVTMDSPLTTQADPTQRTFTATDQFQTGNACDVVVLRAYYQWSVVTPALSWFLVNMAGNYHLLSTAAAFRNEPFTSGASGC